MTVLSFDSCYLLFDVALVLMPLEIYIKRGISDIWWWRWNSPCISWNCCFETAGAQPVSLVNILCSSVGHRFPFYWSAIPRNSHNHFFPGSHCFIPQGGNPGRLVRLSVSVGLLGPWWELQQHSEISRKDGTRTVLASRQWPSISSSESPAWVGKTYRGRGQLP